MSAIFGGWGVYGLWVGRWEVYGPLMASDVGSRRVHVLPMRVTTPTLRALDEVRARAGGVSRSRVARRAVVVYLRGLLEDPDHPEWQKLRS